MSIAQRRRKKARRLMSIGLNVWPILGISVHLGAFAQDNWRVQRIDPSTLADAIVEETRPAVIGGLPDGLVATYDGDGDIASAWYAGPTSRYRHGILGDAVEASTLVAKTVQGDSVTMALPDSEVFEDRYPRLADLDQNGTVEIITIRSSVSGGAAVTVYGLIDGELMQRATTEFIGTPNRWLNIAGIAGFRGSPGKEIAYVRTPHIGGTLIVVEFRNGGLHKVGELHGFSNHRIGAREMRLSAVTDIDGDGRADLALPSSDRRSLRFAGFRDGKLAALGSVALPGAVDRAILVQGRGEGLRFTVGLANGEAYEIGR